MATDTAAASHRRRAPTPPREVRVLIWGMLILRGAGWAYPLLAFRLSDIGAGEFTATALAAFGAGWAVGGLLTGELCDRYGPRLALIAAMLPPVVALPILGTTTSPTAILACAFVAGTGYDALRPLANAVVPAAVDHPGDRSWHLASWHRAANLGSAACGAAAGLLVPHTGLPILFGANAAACALVASTAVLLLPGGRLPLQPHLHTHPDGRDRGALADPRLWLLCAASLGSTVCIVALLAVVPELMTAAGRSAADYGIVQAAGTGAVVIATPLMQPWIRRRAARGRPLTGLLAAGSVLLGASLAAAALATSTTTIAVAIVAGIPGEIAAMIAATTVLQHIGPHTPGRYSGIWGITVALAAILAPLTAHGTPTTTAALLLAAGLSGALLCIPLTTVIRRTPEPRSPS